MHTDSMPDEDESYSENLHQKKLTYYLGSAFFGIGIAILAVGTSVFTRRKNALSENVIIQSIGAASGLVVAGAIFTLPAIYILELDVKFFQVFLASLLGGFLGVLFLIPFLILSKSLSQFKLSLTNRMKAYLSVKLAIQIHSSKSSSRYLVRYVFH